MPKSFFICVFTVLSSIFALLGCDVAFHQGAVALVEEEQAIEIERKQQQQVLKRQKQQALIQHHLREAELRSERAMANRLQMIDVFFNQAEKGATPFSRKMLSFNSKWILLSDYVPFTSKNEHQRFVKREFERHLFSAPRVEKLLERVVSAYLRDLASIESKMLVELRADLEMLEVEFPGLRSESISLDRSLGKMLLEAEQASYAALRSDVANLVVASVLTKIAMRMASSATILSIGGVSGTVTMGVGFIVSLIVDQVVSVVYEWWADPVGDLSSDLRRHIRVVRRLVLVGDASHNGGGVRQELQKIHNKRAQVRRSLLK